MSFRVTSSRLIYGLAALRFLLPFFLQNGMYQPHRDEFLYLAEGQHPAFGYMEVPPLLSLFARVTLAMGGSMFWIKCWPALFGAFCFILVARIITSLGGRSFSIFLLFLGFCFSSFLRVFYLFQPNFLEIFFYTAIGYGLFRYVQTNRNGWLYYTGVAAGLGMLSKYSIAMYIVSVAAGLLFTPQRKIFANRHLWFAATLGFLLFLPNLIWQYVHHFPVNHHMHELAATQLQYVSPGDFLKNQVLMFFPCFFLWIIGLLCLLFQPALRAFRFLGMAWFGVIGILLYFHGKDYYALGLYPVLMGMGCYAFEKWTREKSGFIFYLRHVVVLVILVVGTWFTFLGVPLLPPAQLEQTYQKLRIDKTGANKWEDLKIHPLPQDFSDMLGWEELAQKTAAVCDRLDSAERSQTIVFANNYGVGGALNYYGKKYHLPPVYSDNASFLYWIPNDLSFRNFILITDDTADIHRDFARSFVRARLMDSLSNPYARENGDLILLLEGANDNFRKFLRNKIAADKRELGDQ